ncbi:MAG TPA: hypothetical protein VNQ90_02935 [Chthoniobacteraceae bacterium]|nr:hypothetical protein [Chthoniobacteraceae bacterium]
MSKFKAVIGISAELGASVKEAFKATSKEAKRLGVEIARAEKNLSLAGALRSQEATVAKLSRAHGEAIKRQRQAYDIEKKKVALARKYPHEKEAQKEAAAATKERLRLTKALEQSAAALKKERAELDRVNNALKQGGINTKNLSEETRRLSQESAKQERQLERTNRKTAQIARIGEAYGKVRSRALMASAAIAAVGTAALLASRRVFSFERGYSDRMANLSVAADAMNTSPKMLAGMEIAAARSGISLERLQTHMERLRASMNDEGVLKGKGKLFEAFKDLGVDPRKYANMQAHEIFQRLAYAVQNYKGGKGKLPIEEILRRLGGEGMSKVVGVFKEGQYALEGFSKEAEALGIVPTKEMAERALELEKAFLHFDLAKRGFSNKIGDAIAPVFIKYLNEFTTWVKENPKRIEELGKSLGEALETGVEWVKKLKREFRLVLDAIEPVTGKLTDTEIALTGIGAVTLGPVIGTLGLLAGSAVKLANALVRAEVSLASIGRMTGIAALGGMISRRQDVMASDLYKANLKNTLEGKPRFGETSLPTPSQQEDAGLTLKKVEEIDLKKKGFFGRFFDGDFGKDLLDTVINKIGSTVGGRAKGADSDMGPTRQLESIDKKISLIKKPNNNTFNNTFHFTIQPHPTQDPRSIAEAVVEQTRLRLMNPALAAGSLSD